MLINQYHPIDEQTSFAHPISYWLDQVWSLPMLELITSFLINNITSRSLVMLNENMIEVSDEGEIFLNDETSSELSENHFLVDESGIAVSRLASDTNFIVRVLRVDLVEKEIIIEQSKMSWDVVFSTPLQINRGDTLVFKSDFRDHLEIDIEPGQCEVVVAGRIADYEDVFPRFSDDISDKFKVDWTTLSASEKPSVWNYIFIPIEECSEVLPKAQVHKPFTFWPTPAHLRE